MKQKHLGRIIIAIGVFALSIYTLWPTYRVLSQPQDFDKPITEQRRANFIKEFPNVAGKAMQLGLDLAGGTHIIVEIDGSGLKTSDKTDVLDRCLEIVRNRVDQFGLSEPILSKSGDNRIVAELAGVDAEAARRLIGATALLEFKLVGEVNDFKATIERIDDHMKKVSGVKVDTSSVDTTVKSDSTSVPGNLFGDVVGAQKLTTATDSAKRDTSTDTSSVAVSKSKDTSSVAPIASLKEISKNPFTSYLVGLPGGGVGVRLENMTKVRRILARPDIQEIIPKRYQILWGREEEKVGSGIKARELFFLKRRAEMTGEYVSDARVQRTPTGEVEVGMDFKDRGPREFARVTGANIKKRLAIVLDSIVYSAPVIQGKITQGKASITGIGEFKEAKLLATTLRAGSLPAPMKIVELRSVGPSMGAENISRGLNSGLWGIAMVVVFMVVYYRFSGMIANLALLFNVAILIALLSLMHATLTLPGIAGIILTIGMAVDANVIIYERIREELRNGKSVRGSVDSGYKRAFTTIFDSNITTIGSAFILYKIGTGPIKGFGLTLMIGIAASMFTAIWLTRLVYDLWLDRVDVKKLSIGSGFKFFDNAKFKWVANSKKFAMASLTVFVVAMTIAIAFNRFNWSIDFTGGHVYQVQMPSTPNVEAIRKAAEQAGIPGARIQSFGASELNEVLISIEKSNNDSLMHNKIQQAVGQGKIIGEETVGPRVGNELKWMALLSIFLSMVVIVLYIWFRFGRAGLSFGVGAIVALVHDCCITFAVYSAFGLEIDLSFVAAILTIIGYSINDTIVVYDRIRENLSLSTKDNFAQRADDAINQSLSRTTITSGATLLTVLSLAFFGGEGVANFAWALLIGIVAGTYSSDCIASPYVVWYNSRKGIEVSSANTKKLN